LPIIFHKELIFLCRSIQIKIHPLVFPSSCAACFFVCSSYHAEKILTHLSRMDTLGFNCPKKHTGRTIPLFPTLLIILNMPKFLLTNTPKGNRSGSISIFHSSKGGFILAIKMSRATIFTISWRIQEIWFLSMPQRHLESGNQL